MGPSKNILNTAPKKMGRLDQMKVFIVLIIVMILVYISLITRYRELGRPNFLQDIFGLTHKDSKRAMRGAGLNAKSEDVVLQCTLFSSDYRTIATLKSVGMYWSGSVFLRIYKFLGRMAI